MKLVFYGNVIDDTIETEREGKQKIRQVIDRFLTVGGAVLFTTMELKMPRKIIQDFPATLDPDSVLYNQITEVKAYFGEHLLRVDYIPVSGDLELIFASGVVPEGEYVFLSNVLLEIAVGMGKIRLLP